MIAKNASKMHFWVLNGNLETGNSLKHENLVFPQAERNERSAVLSKPVLVVRPHSILLIRPHARNFFNSKGIFMSLHWVLYSCVDTFKHWLKCR